VEEVGSCSSATTKISFFIMMIVVWNGYLFDDNDAIAMSLPLCIQVGDVCDMLEIATKLSCRIRCAGVEFYKRTI